MHSSWLQSDGENEVCFRVVLADPSLHLCLLRIGSVRKICLLALSLTKIQQWYQN